MLQYWLTLNKIKGLGPVKLKKLLEEYGSAKAACKALGYPLVDVEVELERLKAIEATAITIEDKNYPKNLKTIHDPPPILFKKGNLEAFDNRAIAIVGTRKATRYGLETAKKFAQQLAEIGLMIVSGLALGIDAAAHEGALAAKGKTIAVLGSGIDQVYPRSNQQLAKQIEIDGAIVSEFPIGQEPDTWTFPQRNRIISGLSVGVIMIEGHYDSGAMITAKEALDQGREVFAVPGNIGLEQSKGPHWLIKQGAKLVESVEDILEELQLEVSGKIKNEKCKMKNEGVDYSELNWEEKRIIKTLSHEPKHLDLIAAETRLLIPQVSSLLMMLEIKRAVKQLPGKMFILS
jgi:DNA processing protein